MRRPPALAHQSRHHLQKLVITVHVYLNMAIFSLTNIAISLVSIYVAHRIYWEVTTGTRRRHLVKQKGTLAVTARVSTIPFFIPTLGIDIIINNYQAYKARRFLEQWQQDLSNAHAHTISMKLLGSQLFLTDDPENIKQLLATGFDVWSLGKERIEQMSSYLGHGVFTNEGSAWRHSRAMLRPCFERHQVADVSLFSKHVGRLVALLPTVGSTIDLQPLLHQLTLDIATEFLFGRSTDSLKRGGESKEVEAFVEAFEYCGNPFLSDQYERWGYLGLVLPDRKRKKCAQTVKGMLFRSSGLDWYLRTVQTSQTK